VKDSHRLCQESAALRAALHEAVDLLQERLRRFGLEESSERRARVDGLAPSKNVQ
jgi:hypothetical protein